jgi:hypothetical protein
MMTRNNGIFTVNPDRGSIFTQPMGRITQACRIFTHDLMIHCARRCGDKYATRLIGLKSLVIGEKTDLALVINFISGCSNRFLKGHLRFSAMMEWLRRLSIGILRLSSNEQLSDQSDYLFVGWNDRLTT